MDILHGFLRFVIKIGRRQTADGRRGKSDRRLKTADRRGNSWGGGQPSSRAILWTVSGQCRVLEVMS